MVDQNQEPIIAKSLEEQQLQHAMNPTNNLFYHAPCSTPLCCSCFGSNNSMKRSSPSSSATEQRACKKLFHEKQQDLTLNGVSTISFPLMHGTFPSTNNTKPSCHGDMVARVSCLSPQPQIVKGFMCDHTPAPTTLRTFSHSSNMGDKRMVMTKEEASNSMRLRRMKECLREMRKWWDEVMQEEEEEEQEEEEGDLEGAEGDKVLSKDDSEEDAGEAVKLEWADRCLSICFKCPCSKGYQILLSENNCYYKLA